MVVHNQEVKPEDKGQNELNRKIKMVPVTLIKEY